VNTLLWSNVLSGLNNSPLGSPPYVPVASSNWAP
jgi:hypothetical protein